VFGEEGGDTRDGGATGGDAQFTEQDVRQFGVGVAFIGGRLAPGQLFDRGFELRQEAGESLIIKFFFFSLKRSLSKIGTRLICIT
jgi:hypothetical protein